MQPVDGHEWKVVNAAGSATLLARPGVLHAVTLQVSVGTIAIYDSASGTSSNLVYSTPTTTAPVTLTPDTKLKRGCYYLATGTPIATFSFR